MAAAPTEALVSPQALSARLPASLSAPGGGVDRMVQKKFSRRYTLMHADEIRTNELTERIIGCSFRVLNTLEAGFLEKVYENALAYEWRQAGPSVEQQKDITVYYDDIVVGEYVADLVIDEMIVVELKAGRAIDRAHTAQCINYLKRRVCTAACCRISSDQS